MLNMDAELRFLNVIENRGMTPPDNLIPGKLMRFPGIGKGAGNKSGWCILFDDQSGGKYGDWSSDLNELWWDRSDIKSPALAKIPYKYKSDDSTNTYKNVAKKACHIYEAASVSFNHPYLLNKQITSNGARLYKGTLVLPIVDIDGTTISLQFISDDGQKRFLKGGQKKGCFIHVGGEFNSTRIIICEGWATGCSLIEDQPDAFVIAALDCHNLLPVAVTVRSKYPDAEIIIAADDDRLTSGNPGLSSANAAALAIGASIASPPWPHDAPKSLSDFNDLAIWLKNGGERS